MFLPSLGRLTSARRPLVATLRIAALSCIAPSLLTVRADAQVAKTDTTTRPDSARRIESVLVRAIRGGDAAPISQKTVDRATIARRQFGQDVPLLLQGATPSLIAHTETGTNWGYSYLRLRGMDQTRINITIDGVPLNDPEDEVLYFANFADLMSNVQSVQVQRGVGTSTAGTASYAGSINFETMPVAQRNAGGDLQLQAGSFGAQRVSASFHSGLLDSRFAVYGRAGALRTNGYRRQSGVEGRSAFVGAGWFGDRDIVKLSALAGLLSDTLSYVGATLEELAQDRRFNPLNPDEHDKFNQQMIALAYTHLFDARTSVNTTLYRNSAGGNYDYFYLPDRYRYNLQHWWYGLTSAVNAERGDWQLNAGVNANTYERAHRAYLRPSTQLYDNAGHKDDASAFAKISLDAGRIRWFADLQGRWAHFRYIPDANAGIGERSKTWAFFNPKLGATYRVGNGVSAYASYGLTSREPARSDLFAGEDDLNSTNVGDYGDFSRVKPESVRDAEVGITWTRRDFDLSANVYSMDFRNDILRVGAPTASGSILRRNVGSSYRRGLELDATYRGLKRLVVGGNATISTNRIASFTDSSRGTPVVRKNVEPLLTPRFLSAQRAELLVTPNVTVALEGRYQSRAFLDNTSSADRVLPAYYLLDGSVRATFGRYALMVRGGNLGDTQKFGSGSVSGEGEVRYFVLPARAVFVTAEVGW